VEETKMTKTGMYTKIDQDIKDELKIIAIQQHTTLNDIVIKGLINYYKINK
jgi:hypothetical protein